jgi:DNA-cytosine methyltransferase
MSVNVLSLFDGISCGQVAFHRAGIEVNNYYAAEIDKHAIKVTQSNWPNTIQLGSVENWREWNIDLASIDYLIGGSPCQGFSFAGKQLAFDDPRSKLFFVYVDILNHIKSVNPNVKFLLENVKMKKEYLDVISEHLGAGPVLINSALLSAQNRQRYYWANWEFGQPEDRGILLADILDKDCIDVQSDGWHEWFDKNKEFQIKKSYSAICNDSYAEKAICMTARQYASWNGNFVIIQTARGNNIGGLRAKNGKTPSITSHSWEHNNHLTNGDRYRKLTPIECERLQTLPDNYTQAVSNTQRYKALGNGWTVDVIAHILEASK